MEDGQMQRKRLGVDRGITLARAVLQIKVNAGIIQTYALIFLGVCGMSMPTSSASNEARTARAPLRVCPENPRYFTDGSGKAVYLTGSHDTCVNVADKSFTDPPAPFDYKGYLDFMVQYHHNLIRLWSWELFQFTYPDWGDRRQYVQPLPWPRTGPGDALDGKPRFDLSRFDDRYFAQLRSRAVQASERGIYVSIMLFEGHGLQFSAEPWRWGGHPFNPANNIDGIDGDPNCTGKGLAVHTLAVPAITRLQENYVRKVVDTVNDLNNVLYEITNESGPYSTAWQYHLISYIKGYEAGKPKQHPVGMTFQYEGGTNEALFASPADWISPGADAFDSVVTGDPRAADDPRPADGRKVIIADTDHLGGGHSTIWVWRSFCRGLNPILIDHFDSSDADPARRSMGYALRFAERMDLVKMKPMGELASSDCCLANPGREYLVYLPEGGKVTVDLSAASGLLSVEWFDPATSRTAAREAVEGGRSLELTAPFEGEAVLYVSAPACATAREHSDDGVRGVDSRGPAEQGDCASTRR